MNKVDFNYSSKIFIVILAGILLFFTVIFSICMGVYKIPLFEVFNVIRCHILGGEIFNEIYNTIVWDIRVPRVLTGMLIGMALATAGATYQGVFRNPLVSPFILGVSSGAAFGAALSIIFPLPYSAQISAFIFGMVAVFCAYYIAKVRGKTPLVTLLLAGVILGSLFNALVSIFQYIATEAQLKAIVFWLMGGLYHVGWSQFYTLTLSIPLGILLLMAYSWKLNILSLGDEEARSLGINTERLKIILITVATFITSLSVSVAGIIGWVGLMIPHAARLIIGPDHRFLLPLSAIMGGIFLILCDTIARTITTGEIPLGIVTSIFGTPYLIYLLRSRKDQFFGGE
ncbi:MAG TPA: iron ABC transporter permease [Methanothermococcus okinawensis]|uniref:Iron complex transport system permease protein n=1 Tax=Methanofervidicoccus abyssi TaxID=2082189 RepID=A0A401HQS4_9EURY|nr:iron ABC transporter permease [Methanofervidicoccus abyssi]GBF36573.1 iron complex transport system permease protein [Methanofervidicoccus abyssi]HIP16563.1 iron ABC transporter permease [Methanothermococcus okinawensis]